jgi:succinate-acetate transporter protein
MTEMPSTPIEPVLIADPGPVGLAAFAMTTFVLSVFNTNMVSSTLAPSVLGLALFYGGGVQVLAGMWEFRKGNTFGALAFSSFGAFWLSFWYYVRYIEPTGRTPPSKFSWTGSSPRNDRHNGAGLGRARSLPRRCR